MSSQDEWTKAAMENMAAPPQDDSHPMTPRRDSRQAPAAAEPTQQRLKPPQTAAQPYSFRWRLAIVAAGLMAMIVYLVVRPNWGPYGLSIAVGVVILVVALVAWRVRGEKP